LNVKVLFLLALVLLGAISTIATTVAATLPTPDSVGITNPIEVTTTSGNAEPTGDPIDDPVFPD